MKWSKGGSNLSGALVPLRVTWFVSAILAVCSIPKLKPNAITMSMSSPVSIQTQSLALRALRKRKPQETQALQSWLPLLRPSIPIGWRLRLLRSASQ